MSLHIQRERLINRFLNGPSGQSLNEQFEAEYFENRKNLIKEISELECQRSEILPILKLKVTEASADFKKAKQTLEDYDSVLMHVSTELAKKNNDYESRINKLKHSLTITASEEIDMFVDWIDDKSAELHDDKRLSIVRSIRQKVLELKLSSCEDIDKRFKEYRDEVLGI